MKSSLRSRGRSSTRRTDGVALVIVLGFLVLLTVLIIAFFTSVTTEYRTTKTYAAGASTRFLTDSSVNLVMGQITKATLGQQPGSPVRYTWASQPGMIRTYGDQTGAGDCYKLYSSGSMVLGSQTDIPAALAADVPAGWNALPANFTDLNAPVTDAQGKLNFPILDGTLKQIPVNGKDLLTYDDDGDGVPDIEGFGISPDSVPNYNSSSPISAANNPAPMPVQWLYLLKDGTLTAPDLPASGATDTAAWTATADATKKPTAANPIVGRIAFWTDDETCKLNINTASEGTFFAYTRVNSPTELTSRSMPVNQNPPYPNKPFGFAISPPAAAEYNRYPGHPATTCLSPALGSWLNNPKGASAPNAYTSAANDTAFLGLAPGGALPSLSAGDSFTGLSAYLLLSPKSSGTVAGSQAGTVLANRNIGVSGNNGISSAANPLYTTPVNNGARLYGSVDELIFRIPVASDAAPRTPFPNAKVTNTMLERGKFILTASSRAPELTPFNTPKVSMWPQWYAKADRTARSQLPETLLAFCSSIGTTATAWSGKNEYFFQYYSSGLSGKSSVCDWNNVQRNQLIGNYLYNLGNHAVPGYGSSFVTKYNQIDNQTYSSIIVESLDFIRSGVTSKLSGGIWNSYAAPLVVSGGLHGATASTPLKGFGKFPVCTQLALGVGVNSGSTPVPFLIFDYFDPTKACAQGYPQITNVTITNAQNFGIKPLPGHAPLLNQYTSVGESDFNDNQVFPIFGVGYSFPGDATFDNTGPVSSLGSGKPVQVAFHDNDSPQNTFQTLTMTFPAVTGPTPNPAHQIPRSVYNVIASNQSLHSGAADSSLVRSVECSYNNPLNGDWRLLALYVNANQINGKQIFTPHDNSKNVATDTYSNSTLMQGHSMRLDNRADGNWTYEPTWAGDKHNPPTTSMGGALSNLMMRGSTNLYTDFEVPYVPQGMTAALTPPYNIPGDWDTGPGLQPDGPFVNPLEQAWSANWVQFRQTDFEGAGTGALFSPNRLVASPVRFGSLPTGFSLTSPRPWQTLLFCPNPAGRTTPAGGAPTANDHFGFKSPPDHVYLEFFTMPVVQPYAISEPLSTAGKVNLNCQLAPFSYIERTTSLRGVLKNTLMSGISGYNVAGDGTHPTSAAASVTTYKFVPGNPAGTAAETRYDINRDATIAGVEEHYFSKGGLFMYPSQICDVFLVPQYLANATSANYTLGVPRNGPPMAPPKSYDEMMSWWSPTSLNTMSLTGDNLREEPYDRLYPRLTTKSNSYTVHYRVQMLQKKVGTKPDEWTEGKDQVTAEHRGSSLIERYVDPNDPALNANWDSNTMNLSFATSTSAQNSPDLSIYYKFRVISTKQFAP